MRGSRELAGRAIECRPAMRHSAEATRMIDGAAEPFEGYFKISINIYGYQYILKEAALSGAFSRPCPGPQDA